MENTWDDLDALAEGLDGHRKGDWVIGHSIERLECGICRWQYPLRVEVDEIVEHCRSVHPGERYQVSALLMPRIDIVSIELVKVPVDVRSR